VKRLAPEGAQPSSDKGSEALHGPVIDQPSANIPCCGASMAIFVFRTSWVRAGMRAATKVPDPTVASANPSAISRS
jgi:hypothetical protein